MATGEQSRVFAPGVRTGLSKVPAVTALFWVTKVLTTGMGETTSDYLVRRINPFVAVTLGALAFTAALTLQFGSGRYRPWRYWLAVSMVSVFGTMAADVVHIGFGVPYVVSTIFFAVALAVIFACWYRREHTLSIHSIRTPRRERFYWAAVLCTFALGTAAGDMTASTMHLGYFASGMLFAVVIAIPAVAHWRLGMNSIAAFWFAYVVTRPLGASFADWLGVPASRRGLDLGTGPVTLTLATLIGVLVTYLSVTGADRPVEDAEAAPDTARA